MDVIIICAWLGGHSKKTMNSLHVCQNVLLAVPDKGCVEVNAMLESSGLNYPRDPLGNETISHLKLSLSLHVFDCLKNT